jgi:rod shape-determining protein MreC
MRNLWLFISKYNAFFLFVIFFVSSLTLLLRYNSYQKASVLNSSNQVVGTAFENVNHFESYLNLGRVNDSLATENARLRGMLKLSKSNDSVVQKAVNDTLTHQQYTYIVAKVINNSVNQKNNFITLNRGKKHGIVKGMGVISPGGVVGIVADASDNFSTVQSVLNNDTRISATIVGSNAPGSLIWGIGNFDYRQAVLQDIPNDKQVKRGARVVTTPYSAIFPAGIPIGTVIATDKKGGSSFLDIEVKLSVDFSNLGYVYVVNNLMAAEQLQLEANSKKDE